MFDRDISVFSEHSSSPHLLSANNRLNYNKPRRTSAGVFMCSLFSSVSIIPIVVMEYLNWESMDLLNYSKNWTNNTTITADRYSRNKSYLTFMYDMYQLLKTLDAPRKYNHGNYNLVAPDNYQFGNHCREIPLYSPY